MQQGKYENQTSSTVHTDIEISDKTNDFLFDQ